MDSYQEWKVRQMVNELSQPMQAAGMARGMGTIAAGVGNQIMKAINILAANPQKNRILLNRVYRYIVNGLQKELAENPDFPEDEKEALLQAFPSAGTAIGKLTRGARRPAAARMYNPNPINPNVAGTNPND